MGLWKRAAKAAGKASLKASKKLARETGKLAVAGGKIAVKEAKTRYARGQRKKELLHLMEMKDLKKLGAAYGVPMPDSWVEEDALGGKTRVTATRENYVDRLLGSLSLEQIEAYSKKRKK